MPDEATNPSGGTGRRRRTRRAGGVTGASVAPAEAAGTSPAPATVSVEEDGESITADHVEVTRAAVGRVDSRELSVQLGAVGAARADRIEIDRGALGATMAGEVSVQRGFARTVLARHVELEQAGAQTIVANVVEARGALVGFLIARRVGGEVKVLFDWRGALAFGAAAGLLGALLSRGRRGRPGRGR